MEITAFTTNISLAVLPLQVLADDPKTGLFCQGLVMDLITDLSRFRSFQIIAQETSGSLASDTEALDHLQLDYLVRGMARRRQDQLIVNLQLVNVRQNRLVWAEKFSGGFDELFLIQEEIVEKIVMSLRHFVDHDLLADVRKKPLTNLNAYECWLRGLQELKKGTLEADEQARVYFQKALKIDPHFARAYTGMSLTYFNEWSCQIWDRWEVSRKGAFEWAQKALDLDEWDHVSSTILGKLHLFNGDYEKAEHCYRKAYRLNPNDAEMLLHIAMGYVYLGNPEEAFQIYRRARRINPGGDDSIHACGAWILFELGKYDEAIALSETYGVSELSVDFPAMLAAASFMLGEVKKMQSYWQVYLERFTAKINQGRPADRFTAMQWVINTNPYRYDTRFRPFWEYLGRGEGPLEPAPNPGPKPASNCFTSEAGLWTLAFAGKQVLLPEVKGFLDLARLLAAPNAGIHCTDLMGAAVVERGEAAFDEKAKKAYRRKILELRQEIEEAAAFHDPARTASLQREYDQLLDHLSRSVGKGGRTRRIAGSTEKARTAVTWRIRSAIKKIAEAHPQLGRHLEISVKTGVFCTYTPEAEIAWQV